MTKRQSLQWNSNNDSKSANIFYLPYIIVLYGYYICILKTIVSRFTSKELRCYQSHFFNKEKEKHRRNWKATSAELRQKNEVTGKIASMETEETAYGTHF